MAYAEFYNLNANIAYPFVPTSTDTFQFITGGTMPKSLIVDCGFSIGALLNYDPEAGAVYLHSLTRNGNNLEFRFRVTPDDGVTREFLFVRDKDALLGLTDYVEATGGPAYGVGFLATGNVLEFYDTLAPGEVKVLMSYSTPGNVPVDSYEATVEPAVVVSLARHSVLTVSVGNMLRLSDTPCTADAPCGTPEPIDNVTVKLQAGADHITGRLRLRGGYNVAVSASAADNAISLSAAVGQGIGEACDNDPIRYVGDVPDVGARCRDYIFSIDGIEPNAAGAFQLEGGGAFYVQPQSTGFIIVNSKIGQVATCNG